MGFADRFRALFSKQGNPRLAQLRGFAVERKGVEGFIEPRTTTNPTTLLLVDRDGDHRRAPVRSPREAATFCDRNGIPVYDARVVGYPKRMKDFDRRGAAAGDALDERFAELERRFNESDPNVPDH